MGPQVLPGVDVTSDTKFPKVGDHGQRGFTRERVPVAAASKRAVDGLGQCWLCGTSGCRGEERAVDGEGEWRCLRMSMRMKATSGG